MSVAATTGTPDGCPDIRWRGRNWRVGRPTQDAKARLEKLVAAVSLEEVRRLKDVLSPAAYQEAFKAAMAALPSYHTWQAGWQAVVFDSANAHLFLWSLLQEFHPQVSEAEVRGMLAEVSEEVEAALAQVIPDFFQMLVDDLVARMAAAIRQATPEDAGRVEEAVAVARAEVDRLRVRLTPTSPTPSVA
jgi:hypothetical protein